MKEPISMNDLFFHPVHGLCRVESIRRSGQGEESKYALQPIPKYRGDVRFIIPESALENSGFSKLMTVKTGNAILEYFKTGEEKDAVESPAWQLANLIRTESMGKEAVKDSRRRQQVDRAVKGLVGELAYVLKMNLKEVARKIQNNLQHLSVINPLVLNAFTKVDKGLNE